MNVLEEWLFLILSRLCFPNKFAMHLQMSKSHLRYKNSGTDANTSQGVLRWIAVEFLTWAN